GHHVGLTPRRSPGKCQKDNFTLVNLLRTLFGTLLGRRLPYTTGTLTVPGPRAAIRIDRDQWGIPHIDAANDHDAWFGLGFCQGQDRAFQLETILRVARGTVAELVGPRGLPVDRLSRRVGLWRSAAPQYDVLSENARGVIDAFAAGITAGMTTGLSRKPHEFALLGGAPTPWTGLDVIAFVKLQSFALPSNWDAELTRLKILSEDGSDALLALDPVSRHDLPAGTTVVDRLAEDLSAFREVMPPVVGSNNWVIAAARTASGRPLVANDPHLPPALPSQWYLAHIRTPEWALAGGTFAGSPGFAAGFNGHVAWGVTAGLTDNADLFLEQLSPDGRRVKQGDQFVECRVHEEIIKVKGEKPVTETVVETPRGPVISPVLGGGWPALSLRAVWLLPLPIRGLLDVARAKTIDEFRACFDQWPALPLNVVFADTAGHTGWQLIGQAPRRKKGSGVLPSAGWDEAAGWHDDLVPFAAMPKAIDPPEGFFATANNEPVGHAEGPFLGVEWLAPYRYEAIREGLAAKTGWTVADCQRLQMTTRSLPWREFRDVVLKALEGRDDCRAPFELLRNWDGDLAADSRAATVYELFIADMIVRAAKAKAPKSYEWLLGKTEWEPPVNLMYLRRLHHLSELLRRQPAGWFARPWVDEIADAVAGAVRRWSELGEPKWGAVHPARPKSPLLGDVWPFKHVFSCGPAPVGGDTDTVSQTSVRPLQPVGDTDNIAGMRLVIDVGNWSASRFVLAGGQSGNPLSPHYADLFELWKRGEGVPMAWTPEEVQQAVTQTLMLNPA
ncbi:MAG: penicillin acylase family protein, partial [Gemmataceae bacterium]